MILRSTIFAEMITCTKTQVENELEIENVELLTQQEIMENASAVTSSVWLHFRRMLLRESNKLIANFVWCTFCKQITPYYGSTTSRLIDHRAKCKSNPNKDIKTSSKINFKLNELAELKEAAARFVVKDCQPFYAINGVGLLDLCYESVKLGWNYPQMSKADLASALPCPNTIKPRVNQMALDGKNMLVRKIRQSVSIAKRIAATTDLWTEPFNSTSILALTLHFFVIDEASLKLETHTVDLREIPELSATGAVIKSTIYRIFQEYGLIEVEVDAYVCMVSDRGSNMLAAFSGLASEVCLPHRLNNVTQQIMKVSEVKDIVKQSAALVTYMKQSHTMSQMSSKLKNYPETRFNYAFEMLQSIIENYTEVYNVLRAKEESNNKYRGLTDKITCLPIEKMKEICGFLKFFKDATTTVEGDKKVTLHKVWPILRELWAKLQPNGMDSDMVASMKSVALQYIEKPENERYFQASLQHKIALFLHPMMNRLQFLPFRGN